MSAARNCPLLYQLNALQIQPLQHYPSYDTMLDPDDVIPSRYEEDEPDATAPDPEPPPLHINPNINIGDAYTPPIARTVQLRRIKIHSITKHKVDPPPHLEQNLTTIVRAQLDTGADITCANIKAVLHNYKPYTQSFPCKVRLVGAIGNDGDKNMGVYPLGEGTLHVPASTSSGHMPVRCVYSPHLTSTLLCEDDILRSQNNLRLRDFTTTIVKYYEAGTFSLKCQHLKQKNKQFCTHGIITIGNKCYAQPLILPDLPATHPDANECDSFDSALIHDRQFARDCCNSTIQNVKLFQQRSHEYLVDQLRSLPENYSTLSTDAMMKNATDVNAIRAQTERLSWHQRLSHPSDDST